MSSIAQAQRKRASAYHHGDLRSAVLEATCAAVESEGIDALTLRAVAARVGVSAPAVYHHFASKTALLAAAAGVAFERLDDALARAHARAGWEPAPRLEAMAVAYVRFALKRRGDFRLIYGGHVAALGLGAHPEAGVPGRAAKARLRAAIADAFAERGTAIDLDVAVAIVWGQLVGIASLVAERELGAHVGIDHAERLARTAIRSHLAGLGSAG